MVASRQNERVSVFDSATRSGKNSKTVHLLHHRGLIVVVDVTATNGDGTEDLAVRIRVKDPVTDKVLELITDEFTDATTATRWYALYPGMSDGQSAFDAIEEVAPGGEVEVELETLQGGGSGDHTYSVGAIKLI